MAQNPKYEKNIDFKNLVELSPEAIVVHTDGKIVYANKSACELLNANSEVELLDKEIIDLVHPDYKEFARKRTEKMLRQGSPGELVNEVFMKLNGEQFNVGVSAKPLIFKSKQSIEVAFHDITSRIKAQEALMTTQQRFSTLVDAAAVVILVISNKHKILEFNPAAEALYGVKKADVLGKDYFELFLPHEAWQEVDADIKKVLNNKQTLGFEHPIRKKDGTTRYMQWSVSRLNEFDENCCAVLAVGQDITERKNTEVALASSEELYRKIMESANDAILLADAKTGLLLDANQKAQKLTGRTRDELIGQPQTILHPPEEALRYRAIFNEYILKGKGVTETLYAQHKSGKRTPIEISANFFESNNRQMLLGIFRDITERKESMDLSEALNTVNKRISSSLEFNKILQAVVEETTKALKCDTSLIYLLSNKYISARFGFGLAEKYLGVSLDLNEAIAAKKTIETQSPVIVNDAENDPQVNRQLIKQYGVKSIMLVPLITQNRVIGVMAFQHQITKTPFNRNQIQFAKKVASSVSLAIENADLLIAQRNIADTLQEALLTIPESIEGIDFGHLYHSATETARVGGDFYELFEIEHERIGVVIGDVSGKGIKAATLTSLVKSTIKAFSYEESSPSTILAKINEIVLKNSSPTEFVTIFFGILEVDSGNFVYCCAGHPEQLIKKGSEITKLKSNSPALGIIAQQKFIDDNISLSNQDILVLYTDGVIEARCDSKLFGEERLMKLVSKIDEPVKAIPQLIYNQLLKCSNNKLSDDIALLTLALT